MDRFDFPPHTTHTYVVRRTPITIACAPEHLARCRQVAEHHTVEGDDRDKVSPPPTSFQAWRNSCEHCLFSHWPALSCSP
jgi:hypothetical protein